MDESSNNPFHQFLSPGNNTSSASVSYHMNLGINQPDLNSASQWSSEPSLPPTAPVCSHSWSISLLITIINQHLRQHRCYYNTQGSQTTSQHQQIHQLWLPSEISHRQRIPQQPQLPSPPPILSARNPRYASSCTKALSFWHVFSFLTIYPDVNFYQQKLFIL